MIVKLSTRLTYQIKQTHSPQKKNTALNNIPVPVHCRCENLTKNRRKVSKLIVRIILTNQKCRYREEGDLASHLQQYWKANITRQGTNTTRNHHKRNSQRSERNR